jgi:hypothetical protein
MDLKSAKCPIPTLHAMGAMRTALRFYSLNTTAPNANIVPPIIAHGLDKAYNTVPKELWGLDLLSADRATKFLSVVEEIRQVYEALQTLP